MPFTLSHAVVALPFVRTPLVPSAIAIGAMTPDLPLFVRTGIPGYATTHNLERLPITFVMALVLFLLWRFVLRPATRALAPLRIAERLPPEWDRRGGTTWPVATALWLTVSLALGIVTHIVWDTFTHDGRSGIAVLDDMWGPLPGVKWLQYGSSVLGVVILALWAARWLYRQSVRMVPHAVPTGVKAVWMLSVFVIIALVGVAYLPLTASWTFAHWAYATIPLAAGIWGIGTIVLCLVLRVRRVRTE